MEKSIRDLLDKAKALASANVNNDFFAKDTEFFMDIPKIKSNLLKKKEPKFYQKLNKNGRSRDK